MRDWPNHIDPQYQRAIFMDRDGTINIDTHYPHRMEDLILVPGALEGICLLSELAVHLIVVSNQAGIPLGIFTRKEMSAFNAAIHDRVLEAGGRLDAFYYSPYPEKKDLPSGALPDPSSKPSPGMLLEAAIDFSLDLKQCFIVGDKTSDIVAGKRVNCTAVLVLTGKAAKEEDAIPAEPDYVVPDLYDAALLIQKLISEDADSQKKRNEGT